MEIPQKVLDITNKKFNKLTAIEYKFTKNSGAYWLFKCDCGNNGIYRAASVKFNRRLSCGKCFNGLKLNQEILKYFLEYDPETGLFKRNINNKGRIYSGCNAQNGYVIIRINDVSYGAHRLAWLYVYGYLPENNIDHINKDRSDNRIKNLREASIACNRINSKINSNNSSGVMGVFFDKKSKKWRSQIITNGKYKYLGLFDDFTEAVAHRLAAEQCLKWPNCNSTSTAYVYMQNIKKEM